MGAAPLFIASTVIWGSTWLVITYQLGVVPAAVSVVWRFLLAGLLLMAYCAVTRRPLRFSHSDHHLFAAQGALMFSFNYLFVYWAEQHVVSGLVAVAFSTLTFMSLFAQRMTFGTAITRRALLGALLGVSGVAVLFLPELLASKGDRETALGMVYAVVGTFLAALGGIVAGRIQQRGLPVMATSAWGMLYGAAASAIVVLCTGVPWAFDARVPYLLSLIYLAVFGTVLAFLAYLTLMRKVGMANASYVNVCTPVVALLLSALVEGYRFTFYSVAGIALAVAGNIIVLRKRN
jgi:drug/metabolite transporter (DMT)-like permease